jgi:hypothetical protein
MTAGRRPHSFGASANSTPRGATFLGVAKEDSMESTATRAGVDLTAARTYPGLALILALFSIPGSTVAWDTMPGGGYVFGFPPAIAAVVLGVQHLRRGQAGRGKAIAAIAMGGAMLALMVVWTTVESV